MALDALSEVSDEDLLVLYAKGDLAAARALTVRLTPRILGFATRVLHDRAEADDVAQEAMLRLWRIAPEWRRGEARVTTWLYRVVLNLCTDRLRRAKATALDTVPEAEDGAPTVLSRMIEADRAAALAAALAALPDRQRQAVALRHLEGMTNPEIAEIMDIGVEAVESLVARGKRGLAMLLSGRRAELGYEGED